MLPNCVAIVVDTDSVSKLFNVVLSYGRRCKCTASAMTITNTAQYEATSGLLLQKTDKTMRTTFLQHVQKVEFKATLRWHATNNGHVIAQACFQ